MLIVNSSAITPDLKQDFYVNAAPHQRMQQLDILLVQTATLCVLKHQSVVGNSAMSRRCGLENFPQSVRQVKVILLCVTKCSYGPSSQQSMYTLSHGRQLKFHSWHYRHVCAPGPHSFSLTNSFLLHACIIFSCRN